MKYLKRFDDVNKGLNEAVLSPSELIDTGELYTKVRNYLRWEDMIYPVGLQNIEPIDQKDSEVITDLVRRLLNGMGNRLIATINVVKRYYQDEIDSALSFGFKGEKGWFTDDHMIFYKFKDEWWAVELKILGGYSYYVCDGYEGLSKLMNDLTSDWKSKVLNESKESDSINESSSNQSFRKITYNDYTQKVWGDTAGEDEETEWIKDHWDKFETQEITKIANILYTGRWISNINQDFRPSNKKDIDYLVEDEYLGHASAKGCSLKFLSPNSSTIFFSPHLVITKLKDEWFYIYYKPPGQRYHQNDVMYLECDQWSGLIDCLKWIANAQIL